MSYKCTPLDLANFLFEARKKQGVLQKEVAYKAGMYQSCVCLLENGKAKISIEKLIPLLNALGVDLTDLHHYLKDKYVIQP